MENWTLEVVSKLVSRPFWKRHVERLEVKNCSRMESVFEAVMGGKLFQNVHSSSFLFARIENSCILAYMEYFFSFMWKNALKMRRMWKSANYADPHHRILLDALTHVCSHLPCSWLIWAALCTFQGIPVRLWSFYDSLPVNDYSPHWACHQPFPPHHTLTNLLFSWKLVFGSHRSPRTATMTWRRTL